MLLNALIFLVQIATGLTGFMTNWLISTPEFQQLFEILPFISWLIQIFFDHPIRSVYFGPAFMKDQTIFFC